VHVVRPCAVLEWRIPTGPERKPTLRDTRIDLWHEDAICETRDGTQFKLAPGWIVRLLDWRAWNEVLGA